ncbi:MAG TPA: FAD-binding oxidoreductase [Solirubrobacterales bacterium]|nr:FAD-binding oxidoreductase [Solirubrobacterales bacterium]
MNLDRISRSSWWLEQALAVEPGAARPPLSGQRSADVCVVGGGYTGLWTALSIKESDPSTAVTLLEARECGFGASGRNSGFVLSYWPKIDALTAMLGAERGVRLARASSDAILEIGAFCEQHRIAADFVQSGWYWTATSRAQLGAWSAMLATCAELGESSFREVDRDQLRQLTGSDIYLGGVHDASAAAIQPATLARGLRRVALERGVEICESSPVREIDREAGVVRTAAGSVRAPAIVLATNAWAARLPELRRAIVPIAADGVLTEPIGERLDAAGWRGQDLFTNSRLTIRSCRRTADGRVLFGHGGGAVAFAGRFGRRFGFDRRATARVARDLPRYVPPALDARITHAWAGPVDRSIDGLPIVGRLPGRARVLYGVGFSGNGIAPALLVGRALAALAQGREDEWVGLGLVREPAGLFPPEPVRHIGGKLVRAAVLRKEDREEAGGRAGPIVRALARRAPTTWYKPAED